jgi:fructan beta-fructosidase
MHWGHARSTDLLHWETLDTVLFPDTKGEIFSGSLVFDEKNSSRLGSERIAPLVAVFTQHKKTGKSYRQSQSIAYSLDEGATFIKYKGNPVLSDPNPDFRDPKVFWHTPSKRWIMPLVRGREVCFYNSENLKDWKYTGSFTASNPEPGGIWECPDLSLISVENSSGGLAGSRWVLMISVNSPNGCYFGMQYFVGDFDGSVFTAETSANDILIADFGFDNYAMVTFNGISDRVIALGWMSCWHYASQIAATNFRGAMTIPRELSLRETPSGLRLVQKPVRELESVFPRKTMLENVSNMDLPGVPLMLELILPEKDELNEWKFELKQKGASFVILLDRKAGTITVDRRPCGKKELGGAFYRPFSATYRPSGKVETVSLLIDTASIELFAAEGETVGTFQYFTDGPFEQLSVSGGNIGVRMQY